VGIKDILTKCLKSNNVINVVKAVASGLNKLKNEAEVLKSRGTIEDNSRKPQPVANPPRDDAIRVLPVPSEAEG